MSYYDVWKHDKEVRERKEEMARADFHDKILATIIIIAFIIVCLIEPFGGIGQ